MSADEMLDGADEKVEVEPSPFDAKYSQTATSGIEFTIKGGDNTCYIALL